jgi:formylglycine-generating enzyme required for sulfatase activity
MSRRTMRYLVLGLGVLFLFGGASSLGAAPKRSERDRRNTRHPPIDRAAWASDRMGLVSFPAIRMAINDLAKTFPKRYPRGDEYLRRLAQWEKRAEGIRKGLAKGVPTSIGEVEALLAFQSEVLLANPLMRFDKLLLTKRKPLGDPRMWHAPDRGVGKYLGLPQQSSWPLGSINPRTKWENEISVLSPVGPKGKLSTLFAPSRKMLVTHVDLHFGARKLMFSMRDKAEHWQVYEVGVDGKGLRQITPGSHSKVHNYDSCYLPNGKIVYVSTAPFQGVPCNPGVNVGMMYLMDADGSNIRQICYDQDHNFHPAVMNDGRILYMRWDYTDLPHVWSRIMFSMNPDGTGQRAVYGSNSYWPNGVWYARPIPGSPTQFVGIVTGHHVGRVGELVLFDPAKGRNCVEGVVQKIPGYGKKIVPLIQDKLNIDCWPKFLYPYPMADSGTNRGAGKYFLVSCKPTPEDLWGVYLADVFDNLVLVKEIEDHALLEPIRLGKTVTPPVIPDRVDLSRKDATIFLDNVYSGPGLQGVPAGSVKALRLYTYHFAYQRIVGINNRVGTNGPWEPKRILGTVPVEADGSALFSVPANVPIAMQPLDDRGQALQWMRSWTTAMPGEFVSCTGCHERPNDAGIGRTITQATKRPASQIKPWRGPLRGFSFKREVQPVLDKYCVGCHNGKERTDGKKLPDLRRNQDAFVAFKRSNPKVQRIAGKSKGELLKTYAGVFEPSFITLRSLVRVGGLESDLRLQNPGEWHAETSELIQMLRKGHNGVKLDAEAWDRLSTWIDLNAPCHGTWSETAGAMRIRDNHARRRELQKLYSGIDEDPEAAPPEPVKPVKPIIPPQVVRPPVKNVTCDNWPMNPDQARKRQQQVTGDVEQTIDFGGDVKMTLVTLPTGQFVMGDANGCDDELPLTAVKMNEQFQIGKFEVTNEQFARFDPNHNSRFEHAGSMIFAEKDRGPMLNAPTQPVVRVSWTRAVAFCDWLSKKTGRKVTLPTEAQWEYACRAGSASAFAYGGLDTDFSPWANLADTSISKLAYWGRHDVPDLIPRDARFDDGMLVTAPVGKYKPNAWGLHDMHGNACEWTRSAYRSYPWRDNDGRNGSDAAGPKVIRGGSWRDRPKRCRSGFRLSYPAWQKVYNVGFRVVVESGN